MVFATVEMLSLTPALLPVFAIQVKETLRQVVSQSGRFCPLGPVGIGNSLNQQNLLLPNYGRRWPRRRDRIGVT